MSGIKRPQTDEERRRIMSCADKHDRYHQAAFALLQDKAVVETIARVENGEDKLHISIVEYMAEIIRTSVRPEADS